MPHRRAPRPSSADRHQGTCHSSFAWAAEGGGPPPQRALETGVLTPHQPHAHPLSGSVQPGDHRFAADGVHRHSRPLRPLAEALTPRFPQWVGGVKPPHEDTRVNPVRLRQDACREPLGHRRPAPDGRETGMRGVRLDRPTRDRQRQGAQQGECTAGVGVSPAPLARHAAPPWRWLEAVDQPQTLRRWLHHPGGDTPPGQRLTPRHGRSAASARAHRLERTQQRRLAAERGGGRTAGTPRLSSTDRRQRPATPRALGRRQEETL